jgi:hypothetical protein
MGGSRNVPRRAKQRSCFASYGTVRVRAVIDALKLATNLSDLDIIDAVYRDVSPLLSMSEVRTQDRLLIDMIYHTIRGAGGVSARCARELLLFAQRILPPRYGIPVLLDCASALRRSGSPSESETACDTAFHLAVPFGCLDFAVEACSRMIEMHRDAGRTDEAEVWAGNHVS